MSKFWKIILGIATAWPFLYFLLFILFIFLLIALSPGGDPGNLFGVFFGFVFVIHFLTIFLILGLQIFYIVNAVKSESLTQNMKIVWIIALFFGGFVAMPIYWYINIWKESELESAGYRGLQSGENFDPARSADRDRRVEDPVPPEPHSWR